MKSILARVIAGITLTVICSASILAQDTGTAAVQYNRILFKSNIDKENGSEVLIREAFFPPGWKAPRHYHNGNLFIYVIEGEFEVTMEPEGRKIYRSGDALQMKPGITMDARNPSDVNSLKLSVFQVGKPNAPFVVSVE
jgi:quercetin dioxygenase-like cupin family protein